MEISDLLDIASFLKNVFADYIEEVRLAQRVDKYVSHIKRTTRASMSDEYDMQSLIDYLTSSCIKDFKAYVFTASKKERPHLRKEIINKAVAYARPEQKDAKRRVEKITSDLLKIISKFYEKNNRLISSYIHKNEIEDSINESENNVLEEVHKLGEEIRKNTSQSLSIDKSLELIKQGKLKEAERNLDTYNHAVATSHFLYPDYTLVPVLYHESFRYISRPTSDKAIEKYPPNIRLTGEVNLPGFSSDNTEPSALWNSIAEYAFHNQIPLRIEVKKAEKYLGNLKDPSQYEAEIMVGKMLLMTPPPLSDEIPCVVYYGSQCIADYVILKGERITNHHTIIFSNRQQINTPYHIQIELDLDNEPRVSSLKPFVLSVNTRSNLVLLQYLEIYREIQIGESKQIRVKDLKQNQFVLEMKPNPSKPAEELTETDDRIDVLKRIILIEDYFHCTIKLPDELSEEDCYSLYYLSELIMGNSVFGTWEDFSFEIPITEERRAHLLNYRGEPLAYVSKASKEFILLGSPYHMDCELKLEEIILSDFDKLQKKLRVLEIGDHVKIHVSPNKGNHRCEERMITDESDSIGGKDI